MFPDERDVIAIINFSKKSERNRVNWVMNPDEAGVSKLIKC